MGDLPDGFTIDSHPGDETGKCLRLWRGCDYVFADTRRAELIAIARGLVR